jgi:Na+/H+ antiporter NhaD/arsenite permease-like protein
LDLVVLVVFVLVYVGMLLGEIPGLALDRTGVALLGALVLVASERVTPAAAWAAVDVPTLALLFGLMVVSAQLRLGGFYTWVTRRIVSAEVAPPVLLAAVVGVAGALSAVLANDIVCLAVAPLLVEGCLRRRLNPVPFLLALACAANVGSAATLIGNPQNMLIGQTLRLSFAGFLADALVPALVGLVAVWALIRLSVRGHWETDRPALAIEAPPFDAWQTAKGLAILTLLVAGFLLAPVPREVLALAGAAVLLTSRRMASRDLIGLVDWHLLVLFIGLFVVNHAVAEAGLATQANAALRTAGVDLGDARWLFPATAILSNLVSNVPAVMLLLPHASHPLAGPVLALASTLAGNLLIVGSIANIIVVDQAAALGVRIGWRTHARVGIPVTLLTLGIAAVWLWLRAG